jgi:hypothetical protein
MGSFGWSDIPPVARATLVVLVAAQVSLQAYCLIGLARRPVAQVSYGRKWLWVLVILLGETVGCVVYLVLGKATVAVVDPRSVLDPTAATTVRDSGAAAVDLLYGPDGSGDPGT